MPADIATLAPPRAAAGFFIAHPRFAGWLALHGIHAAVDAIDLPGEVICGHPDRHVVRATIGGRIVYLKREHVVGWPVRWKNLVAGFGPVSRAYREAVTLSELEAALLPGPAWLAAGTLGGRAFLLVADLDGMCDLRTVLRDTALSPPRRRDLAERLGSAVGDLHAAGFDTPDVSAKHAFIDPETFAVAFVDWQSARFGRTVSDAAAARALAALAASVPAGEASIRDRLAALRAYRRATGRSRGFTRRVISLLGEAAARPTVRRQQSAAKFDHRLVWVRGEEVVARPDVVAALPEELDTGPPGRKPIRLTDGRAAILDRFDCPFVRPAFAEIVVGRPWRSPGVRAAAELFRREAAGETVPRLLAFGQRRVGLCGGSSFVLYAGVPGEDSCR